MESAKRNVQPGTNLGSSASAHLTGSRLAASNGFIVKLYRMLEDPDPALAQLVAWTEDGLAFVVLKPTEFSATVLPKFWRHNNIQSFCRQLNLYSFHKIPEYYPTKGPKASSSPAPSGFKNIYFQRNRPDLLDLIKRKTPAAASTLSTTHRPTSPPAAAPRKRSPSAQTPLSPVAVYSNPSPTWSTSDQDSPRDQSEFGGRGGRVTAAKADATGSPNIVYPNSPSPSEQARSPISVSPRLPLISVDRSEESSLAAVVLELASKVDALRQALAGQGGSAERGSTTTAMRTILDLLVADVVPAQRRNELAVAVAVAQAEFTRLNPPSSDPTPVRPPMPRSVSYPPPFSSFASHPWEHPGTQPPPTQSRSISYPTWYRESTSPRESYARGSSADARPILLPAIGEQQVHRGPRGGREPEPRPGMAPMTKPQLPPLMTVIRRQECSEGMKRERSAEGEEGVEGAGVKRSKL